MSQDLGWIPDQETPFHPLVLEVPGRELRVWLQLEAARQRKVLFNAKFVEPPPETAPQSQGAECPQQSTIQGVVLDVLSMAEKDFFSGDLELLGLAIGPQGSPGRSLRLVRHAQQVAALFESYFRLGNTPAMAPEENVNRGWQKSLWVVCEPLIRERTRILSEQKSLERNPYRDATVVRMPEAAQESSHEVQVEWTTSSSTRTELRWIGAQVVELVRSGKIVDLSMVAVVLPPSRAEEYSAQVAGIFSEEFNIPFALHESLNNKGKGFAPAFAQVLALLVSDVTNQNMKAVLELEAFQIARTTDEEKLLERWIKQLGVVNGLTAEDLENTFVTADEIKTKFHWMQAVDKLCELALAVPLAESQVGVARGMFGLVHRLTKFVDTLADFRRSHVATHKTLADWVKALRILALNLFEENMESAGPADRAEFLNLIRIIKSLDLGLSTSDRFNATLIVELLRRPLLRGRPRRTGGLFQRGVSVFALKPGALRVPFTHVFITGAEDGQLPRTDRISGMHLFPRLALERSDTSKARDLRALRDALSQPNRKVFVSHVEKNIVNGEKKRPSYELKKLISQDVVIRQAPMVRVVKARSKLNTISGEKVTSESRNNIKFDLLKQNEKRPEDNISTRRVSIRALEDVVQCPVLAHAKHNLGIAENPIPKEQDRYPDIEISYLQKRAIIKDAFEKWLTQPSEKSESMENLLKKTVESRSESSAIPSENLIAADRSEMLETLQNLENDVRDYTQSLRFSLGQSWGNGETLVLPELNLNESVLSGRLPGCVHFNGSTITVTVLTGGNPPDQKSKFILPIEASAKAMITLCTLRCLLEKEDKQRDEKWAKQFRTATHWQIRTMSSFLKGVEMTREKTIAAWPEEEARAWLSEILALLNARKLVSLAPLKTITKEFKGKKEKYGEKIRKKFSSDHLGDYPYDDSLLTGNFIINMNFEDNLADVLPRRYPWLFE